MRYFKIFTGFFSGFASFTALLYLFRRYMTFDFSDEELGFFEKIKEYFSKTQEYDKYVLLLLAMAFALSVIAGIAFKRLPYLAIPFNMLSLALSIYAIECEYVVEYPMMYPLAGAFGVIGTVYECARMDGTDGKHRCAHCGNIASAVVAAFCFGVYKAWQEREAKLLLVEEEALEIGRFENEIYAADMEMEMFLYFAVVFAVFTLLGIFLADIYFIDALVSIGPCVAAIYYWETEKLSVHPEVVITLFVTVLALRVIPTVSCRATYRTRLRKSSIKM